MGASDEWDRIAESNHALGVLVDTLIGHMRILRVAVTEQGNRAKEAATAARVGVVTGWCPKHVLRASTTGDVEWCAFAGAHDGPCSFEKPSLF